jgi:hypothetical protein
MLTGRGFGLSLSFKSEVSMQFTYEQYFDIELDYALQQEKDGGDRGSANKFRYLPKDRSQRAINDAIRELVLLNKDRYYAEVTVQLYDSEAMTPVPGGFGAPITDGVLYINTREALSSDLKTVTLPPNVAELLAVQATNGKWVHLTQGSSMQKDMYVSSASTIHREDGWDLENITEGEVTNSFKAQLIMFPVYERIWNVLDITGYDSAPRIELECLEDVSALQYIKLSLKKAYEDSDALGWDQIFKLEDVHAIAPRGLNTKGKYTWNVKASSTLTGNPLASMFYANFDFTNTEVPFPIEHRRLLTLTIKKNAYARQSKPLSREEYSDMMHLANVWRKEGGKIRSKIVIPARGHGFGRRR